MGRQDPYVQFTVDGQSATIRKKTKVDTDGGTDPHWDEMVYIDIVDHYNLEIEVFDHDLLSAPDLIGKVSVCVCVCVCVCVTLCHPKVRCKI